MSEQWLVDLGTKLRAYPLPDEGIADELMIEEAEGFAIAVAPWGSLGSLVVKVNVKVHDFVRGLTQRAELNLVTEYGTIDRFSRELVAAARAGTGEARIGD